MQKGCLKSEGYPPKLIDLVVLGTSLRNSAWIGSAATAVAAVVIAGIAGAVAFSLHSK